MARQTPQTLKPSLFRTFALSAGCFVKESVTKHENPILQLLGGVALWLVGVLGFTRLISLASDSSNIFTERTLFWIVSMVVSLLGFAIAVHAVKRTKATTGFIPLLAVVAAATLFLQISSPIGLSTDFYRYIWQGRVSNAGIDAYATTPNQLGYYDPINTDLLERMDWPDVTSIYPPAAEQFFQIHATLFDVAEEASIETRLTLARLPNLILFLFSALLLYGLTKSKLVAGVWLLNPFTQFELVNSAHIEILVVVCILLAIFLALRKQTYWHLLAGVAIGFAVFVKISPVVLIIPILAWVYAHRSGRSTMAFLAGIAVPTALYIPTITANNYAWINRVRDWTSASDFSLGNPIYELLFIVFGASADEILKVLGLGLYAWLVYRIASKVIGQDYNRSDLINSLVIASLIGLLVSPVILPWYWITIISLLLIKSSLQNRTRLIFTVIAITIALSLQYIDRHSSTSQTLASAIIFMSVSLIAYLTARHTSVSFLQKS